MSMKCPICDKKMEVQEYFEEHIQSEQHTKCEDEYHYYQCDFAYGTNEVCIGPATFQWSYDESEKEAKHRHFIMKVVTYYEREWYQKCIQKT